MEKITKDFKGISQFIGFLAVLQILNLVGAFETIMAMDVSVLGAMDYTALGISTNTILTIVKVMTLMPYALSIVALSYLCIKGLREANDPSPAKFHLILAVICAVCYTCGAVDMLITLFSNSTDLLLKILEVVISAFTAVLLFYYFSYAKKIRTKE